MNMPQKQAVLESEWQEEIGLEGGQYLTFLLAGEEYGVEILKVQEIKGWDRATSIPNTPDHMLGVLNLRGAIVPIMDLRKRFNLDSVEYTAKTVVIVVKITQGGVERVVGLVVDAVADVHELDKDGIFPAPNMRGTIQAEFVQGLACIDEKMVILLDVDNLIDLDVVEESVNNLADS